MQSVKLTFKQFQEMQQAGKTQDFMYVYFYLGNIISHRLIPIFEKTDEINNVSVHLISKDIEPASILHNVSHR